MKPSKKKFVADTKMTARTLPAFLAQFMSAAAVSAISAFYAGINLRFDAATPKPAPLGGQGRGICFCPGFA